MRTAIILLLALPFLVGCSSLNESAVYIHTESDPLQAARIMQSNRWNWGNWVFHVDKQHSKIEAVPVRELDLHYNVLKFVEGPPCYSCLMFGQPHPQGDGSFTVKIVLRHPFPGHPEYTGFDVRGTVVFPATHHWIGVSSVISEWGPPSTNYGDILLYFSRSTDGGGEILNADGFSYYLFPGFPSGSDLPICGYQDGKYATGSSQDLDATVNPFVEFHNIDERRIFTCDGQVERIYHVKPPIGEFSFGYIVDASWAPAENQPVTNPALDFPDYANAEDGYTVEAFQIQPIKKGTSGYNVIEWTIHHRKEPPEGRIRKAIAYCPDIPDDNLHLIEILYHEGDPNPWPFGVPPMGEKILLDPWTSLVRLELTEEVSPTLQAGKYDLVLVSWCRSYYPDDLAYFLDSPTLDILEVEVVD